MHKLAPFTLLLLLGAILTGCLFNPPGIGDGLSAPDTGLTDTGTTAKIILPTIISIDAGDFVVVGSVIDAGTPDTNMPDGGMLADASHLDAGALDSGAPDTGTLDAGFPDAGRLDSGIIPDAGNPDAGNPPVPAACAAGVVVGQMYSDSRMIGCAGSENQHDAHSLCTAGAHLCTLDEYAARGGTVPLTGSYWVASCLIDNGVPQGTPTQSVCSRVEAGDIPANGRFYTDWDVSGVLLDDSGNINTGVAAIPTNVCHRLGTDAALITSHCTYAQNYGSWALIGAMCCTP